MNVRALVLPLCAVGVGLAFWWSRTAVDTVPAATWRIGDGDAVRQAVHYDELAPETPLRVAFTSGEPRHVYVFSRSDVDGTLLLFPSPDVKADLTNPLPAGRTLLPGRRDDRELAWNTRSQVVSTTTYVLVAAVAPVAELETLLPGVRRWTNSVLTDGSMQVTKPAAGVDVAGPPRTPWPTPLLRRAAEQAITESLCNGPLQPDTELPEVWFSVLTVKEQQGPAPGATTAPADGK